MDKCDKCQGSIISGGCPCGEWYDATNGPPFIKIMERAILAYDFQCEQTNARNPLTGDHYSGVCMALWYGDYESSEKVRLYIESLRTNG